MTGCVPVKLDLQKQVCLIWLTGQFADLCFEEARDLRVCKRRKSIRGKSLIKSPEAKNVYHERAMMERQREDYCLCILGGWTGICWTPGSILGINAANGINWEQDKLKPISISTSVSCLHSPFHQQPHIKLLWPLKRNSYSFNFFFESITFFFFFNRNLKHTGKGILKTMVTVQSNWFNTELPQVLFRSLNNFLNSPCKIIFLFC